ncbi:Aminotransferase class I/classII domain-containing protein [Plasmodiophora brassicae]
MDEMRRQGTYKIERILTSPQSHSIRVASRSKPVLNFCANNYLGLSNDPRLVERAKQTLDERGFGLSSVRFICGTQDIHKELEAKLSKFHGTEDTILYPSCFDANAGLFEAILTDQDAIISDALNHASIIDGIRLCKAKRLRYVHLDVDDLEAKLVEAKDQRFRLIATDGAFSMDGDVAPLKQICDLADQHDSLVFVDDCHATGFFGATGRGSPEHQGVEGRVDVINSTLGKALGGATGGYSTGRREIIEILRQKSRPYLFSNALAPAVVGAGIAVIDMLTESSGLVEKLATNTKRFRTRMKDAGFNILGSPEHAIAPVLLGDAALATRMADDLLELGIYVIGFSYPVVPKDAARIRVQLSAAHSLEEVDQAVDAFIEVGKKLNVIR